jgi:hypothetical protein
MGGCKAWQTKKARLAEAPHWSQWSWRDRRTGFDRRDADDANTGVALIEQVADSIKCVIGDTAYDTAAIYEAAGAKGAEAVVPPVR